MGFNRLLFYIWPIVRGEAELYLFGTEELIETKREIVHDHLLSLFHILRVLCCLLILLWGSVLTFLRFEAHLIVN